MPYSFRDLRIWQDAYALMIKVYTLTKTFPKDEQFGLTNQIQRSSISIMSNIAEGHSRSSHAERIRFLIIARGSLEETRSHLSAANGLEYLQTQQFAILDQDYEKLLKGINSFITSLRKQ